MADLEDVYCTLVMNDDYLPGAVVLAHSLRDAGTSKKLACLIVQDGLQEGTLAELRALYNYVIPVERIGNPNPANLYLMNRPDLLYTFTKVNLWAQTQFRKIVYIDADVVALRAPEELFDIQEDFAAAPDVGWPDAFNTGVMVISPHMGEYNALRGLAGAGDSFDGADQGLLNQYYEYRPWKRISFTYNTTPSANYQYEPAYRYFKRDISLVHFIGGEKPWRRGRSAKDTPNAFQEMLSRWWAVYDRHSSGGLNEVSSYVQRENIEPQQRGGSGYSTTEYPIATTGPAPPPGQLPHQQAHHYGAATVVSPLAEVRPQFSAPRMEWDGTRAAPPVESRPEAANFPTQTYQFNTNPTPFRPPTSYPEPPKDMWYSVPEKPKPQEKPKPIFPWEERETSRPTRRFDDDEPTLPPPPLEVQPEPYADELEVSSDSRIEPVTPVIRINDDPWSTFTSNRNAWDDVSGIENYVRSLTSFQRTRGKVEVLEQNEIPAPETSQTHTRASQVQQHILSPSNEPTPEQLIEKVHQRRESLILTDFPTAIERPSLPVTPAPRRRPNFWGEERDNEGDLPVAEGVPDQVDWDPSIQLEQLRRNSLIGPSDLKMPEKKLANRQMPLTAMSIPEEASDYPKALIVNTGDTTNASATLTTTSTHPTSSEGFGPPELDGSTSDTFTGLSSSSGETYFESSDTTSSTSDETTVLSFTNAQSLDFKMDNNESLGTQHNKETAVNTAINSSSGDVTAADKASLLGTFSTQPSTDTVSATVGVDELNMKHTATSTSSEDN